MVLVVNQRLSKPNQGKSVIPDVILALTAEERTRSRYRFETEQGNPIFLRLPRGTVLEEGDLLQAETEEIIQIRAKYESVVTVTSADLLDLLRAAYHLGNRHVALEITPTYLRLSPDPVLQELLNQFNVTVTLENAPFNPERGAYH